MYGVHATRWYGVKTIATIARALQLVAPASHGKEFNLISPSKNFANLLVCTTQLCAVYGLNVCA